MSEQPLRWTKDYAAIMLIERIINLQRADTEAHYALMQHAQSHIFLLRLDIENTIHESFIHKY